MCTLWRRKQKSHSQTPDPPRLAQKSASSPVVPHPLIVEAGSRALAPCFLQGQRPCTRFEQRPGRGEAPGRLEAERTKSKWRGSVRKKSLLRISSPWATRTCVRNFHFLPNKSLSYRGGGRAEGPAPDLPRRASAAGPQARRREGNTMPFSAPSASSAPSALRCLSKMRGTVAGKMDSGFVSPALGRLASPDFTFRATSRFSTEGGPKILGLEGSQRRAGGGSAPARKENPETASHGRRTTCDRHFLFSSKKLSIDRGHE